MSQLTDRLERDLREIAAGAHASTSAWDSIMARLDDDGESEAAIVLASAPDGSRRPLWLAVAAAALVVITGSVAVLTRAGDHDSRSISGPDTTTNPSVAPPSTVVPTITPTDAPFVGIWVSTDTDGSSQTIEIVRSGDDYGFVLRDAFATACSGAPATMTGDGRLETDARLVIAQPELTCDDGTIPRNGPAPQAELADFTLVLDTETDEFVDVYGVVWRRAGSTDEPIAPTTPVPALAPGTSGGMWPQSTLDDVRAAQELADAGDTAYTWQLDPELAANEEPWAAEIFARFMEDELGWQGFSVGSRGYASAAGVYDEVVFIRCVPDQTNSLSSLYADAPPDIRTCAPTIDELTYETVRFSVTQPERRGASGIWVVQQWEISGPADSHALWDLLYPDFSFRQVAQAVPPSDAEVSAVVQAFLQARIDGAGAEQYVLREPEGSPFEDKEVPLLYATSSGLPFERYEIERVGGPVWPTGWSEYGVRLFAEGETVVEQSFHVVRKEGQLGLVYGYASNGLETTEDGQPVAVSHTEFAGTLSFTSPPLVPRGDGRIEISLGSTSDGLVIIGEDPGPDSRSLQGCTVGAATAPADDATVLARRLATNPDFETATEPIPASIAGIEGLQMDVTFSVEELCYSLWSPSESRSDPAWRMRLYLVDYPESAWPSDSNWRPQVLTIAVIAPEADFELALEQATPIVESVEFQTP